MAGIVRGNHMLTISLRCSGYGWSVCRRGAALFSQLPLQQAIELARVVARDEHRWSHQSTRVEMTGTHSHVVLACFAAEDAGRPV